MTQNVSCLEFEIKIRKKLFIDTIKNGIRWNGILLMKST